VQKTLLRSSLEVLLGRGVIAVTQLVVLAYFARALPKAVMGIIALENAIVLVSRIVLNLGLHYNVIREASPYYDRGDRHAAVVDVIGPATLVRVAATLLLALLFAVAAWPLTAVWQAATPNVDLRWVLLWACLHLVFKNMLFTLGPIFHAQHRVWLEGVFDSGAMLCEKVLAFALFLWWGQVEGYFAGIAAGQLGLTLVAVVVLWPDLRHIRLRHVRAADVRARLRRYWPQYQRVLYRRGFRQLDNFLVAALLPLSELAHYHVARQGTTYLRSYIQAFSDSFAVKIASRPFVVRRRRERRIYFGWTVTLPLLVAVASPWLMPLLGGEGYREAWFLMAVLASSFAWAALADYQLAVLTILGDGRDPVKLEALAGVTGITATAVLILSFGEYGIPWGQWVLFGMLWLVGRRATRAIIARTPAERPTET